MTSSLPYPQCHLCPKIPKYPGEKRCSGCGKGFKINMMIEGTGGNIKRACKTCLDEKIIAKCDKCGIFVKSIPLRFFSATQKMMYGDKKYCEECKPQLEFEFTVKENGKEDKIIIIPIPKGNEYGIYCRYFAEKLANILGVEIEKITDFNNNMKMCPAEYSGEFRKFTITL